MIKIENTEGLKKHIEETGRGQTVAGDLPVEEDLIAEGDLEVVEDLAAEEDLTAQEDLKDLKVTEDKTAIEDRKRIRIEAIIRSQKRHMKKAIKERVRGGQ